MLSFRLKASLRNRTTLSFSTVRSLHLPTTSKKKRRLTSPPTVTEGNHTVTQSTFSSPCVPAHITNSTVNGFDSSFRNANNGTSVTNLPVIITDSNITIWFYDLNTCALGGVGGININGSSTETLDGFKVGNPSCI